MTREAFIKYPELTDQLLINYEKPFIHVKEISYNISNEILNDLGLKIWLSIEFFDSRTENVPLDRVGAFNEDKTEIYFEGSLYNVEKLKLILKFDDEDKKKLKNAEFRVKYEILNRLDISLPSKEFDEHIKDPRNQKIFFSAPFGQGKSTFLDVFFEKNETYNVFKIFPVNYSIASNEDIFKYIKVELLYQLLYKGVEFDKSTFKVGETFPFFFKKNADKIIGALLIAIPKIGRDAFALFKELNQLKEEFIKDHEEVQIDELQTSVDYIQSLVEKEGSLFEDDYYTIIIRQLLSKIISDEPDKKNVLLIDDLDRIDPEHVFRILNVFSAHYDRIHQGIEIEGNKFGFDKIIVVCDFNNIQKIYAHRYGENVDFKGYISKFFSTEPYVYDNKQVYEALMKNIDRKANPHDLKSIRYYDFFYTLGWALINSGQFTLRDLLKLQEVGLLKQKEKLKSKSNNRNDVFSKCAVSPALSAFASISSPDVLARKVENLEIKDFSPTFKRKIEDFTLDLIVSNSDSVSKSVNIEYKDFVAEISLEIDDANLFYAHSHAKRKIPVGGAGMSDYTFNFNDFKHFLLESIKKLKS